MPHKKIKVLKYYHGQKSSKIPFLTDADFETTL